ncbi:sensor histidine kinase [Streptomyces longwoodensis]|uniref:sensor histidine kinase n=1 Tax=Streptomyces longwoodensis TaxID=68231 RepID=UPI00224F144F|nr:sensor histidine kinase [Streptomyces longwoodensis]MCX4997460.1 sensor histidine kinase [Streptomyces longwoodensis]
MTRPVPWIPSVLYGAVLLGGLYYAAIGPGPGVRSAGFAGLLCALTVLDAREWPVASGAVFAPGAVFALRAVLLGAVAALDPSGLSRVLFVLLPFLAFFVWGRTVSVVLGAGCVAALAGVFTVRVPHWEVRAEYISDLLMFALGVVLAIAMAAVAVREQQARARLEGTLAQVAELSAARERNRLARDIHDSLGHHLTAIGIQLEKAEAFASLDAAGSAQAVAHARWSANRALDEVRASVRTLGPEAASGPAGLGRALTDLVHHLDGGSGRITLEVSGTERRPLLVLYRAAQEGLTNACRHSGATQIRVYVAYEEQGAVLRVADNGGGFGTAEEGFGLAGLRERLRLAGGSVELRSSATGTVLTVRVPW